MACCASLGLVLFTALLVCAPGRARGSQGDKEPVYRDCVKQCARTNCTGAKLRGFQSAQPPYMALTGKLPVPGQNLCQSGFV